MKITKITGASYGFWCGSVSGCFWMLWMLFFQISPINFLRCSGVVARASGVNSGKQLSFGMSATVTEDRCGRDGECTIHQSGRHSNASRSYDSA